jgi:glycolate oxidase
VEIDGQERSVRSEIKQLEEIVQGSGAHSVQRALGSDQCERFWQLRREFSYALRDTGLTKLNEDIVVPRGRLEDLFEFTARLQKKHSLPIACFGHAGDGNIHVNVMVDEKNPGAARRQQIVLDELFRKVLALGGAITGEHGIGLAKQPWWTLAVPAETRELHRAIKQALDPNGILNPGKFMEGRARKIT